MKIGKLWVFGLYICSIVLTTNRLVVAKSLDTIDQVIEVKPPDHLDAVKLEQDGHMNEDFRKEIFLGNHESVDSLSEEEQENKLKEVFELADVNTKDGELTHDEISNWINLKINEHCEEAKLESEKLLLMLDSDKDGNLSLKEYMVGYLRSLGHPADKAEQHMVDYDTVEMMADEHDEMIRFKYRWGEAVQDSKDNILTPTEFLHFRHPELNPKMMLLMVENILTYLDQDYDRQLTVEEFSRLPGEVEMPGGMEIDDFEERKYYEERKKEFKTYIDADGNGIVTKNELMDYVNPLHKNQGINEAEKIISAVDVDHNLQLSLKEIMDNKDYILGSKFVDVERNIHDEF